MSNINSFSQLSDTIIFFKPYPLPSNVAITFLKAYSLSINYFTVYTAAS